MVEKITNKEQPTFGKGSWVALVLLVAASIGVNLKEGSEMFPDAKEIAKQNQEQFDSTPINLVNLDAETQINMSNYLKSLVMYFGKGGPLETNDDEGNVLRIDMGQNQDEFMIKFNDKTTTISVDQSGKFYSNGELLPGEWRKVYDMLGTDADEHGSPMIFEETSPSAFAVNGEEYYKDTEKNE